MRVIRHPAILVFLALAVAPVVLFGINGPWYGGGDGPILRPPASFPQRLTPETFRRVSLWFNDRLGMRYPLMVLDSHWRLDVWRLRFRGDVLFGHASWLFFNDSPPLPAARLADFRGALRMSESTIATIDRQVATARAAFGACGKAAFVAIAPNKQSIYPEELRRDGTYHLNRLDGFLARLSPAARSMFIDPRAELRASKAHYGVPVYHPTDSHWNDLGAFIAYRKIVSVLAAADRINRPDLATLEGVEIRAEAAAGGDVATRLLFLPWNFPDQSIVLRGLAQLPLSMRAERDRVIVNNPQGRGKLLILADSFGPPLASLLGRHFAEVEMLSRPTWPALFDGALVASTNADVTIIEIAERSLPELVQAPARLDQICR
jgi:alginate O-acetyltransferase complex protein AlgJ